MELVYLAKASGIAVIFVGHVTKAGHARRAEDHRAHRRHRRLLRRRSLPLPSHRPLREEPLRQHARGRPVRDDRRGLREVTDPGNLFVEQYGPAGPPSGSVITAAMQGSRVLLVEVQALTASSVIGAAKRKVSGVSSDRVGMIIAVLEKRAEMRLAADDVFVNVAGGVKVAEPGDRPRDRAGDRLGPQNRPLPRGTLAVGELGLGGEVRSVPQLEQRLREAGRLGLGHAIVPHVGGNTSPSSAAWPCTKHLPQISARRRRAPSTHPN
jgi:DNA repair protein RadA/Sms